jgi:hypothetical protein
MSVTSDSFPAIGTTALVAVTKPEALPKARRILRDELAALDAACSRFRADSELVLLTRSAGAEVGEGHVLLEAVRTALDVAARTSGLVDPTVGATLRLAGYDRTFGEIRLRDGRLVRPSFPRVAGSLAGYVSSAASGHKTARAKTTSAASKAKKTTQVSVPATPPAPSLTPSGSQSSSSQAPAQAPLQSQAPPVAVSGGS